MNTSSNAAQTAASATSPIPTCYRAWCVMDRTPEEHYDHHCSDGVDLTNPTGVFDQAGYWGWLVERFAIGEPVMVGFEGRPDLDCSWDRFEISATHLQALVRILDDPRGRAGVKQLLAWFD